MPSSAPRNVLGGPLKPCSDAPRTGFFRDGYLWEWPEMPGHPLLINGDLPKLVHPVPRFIPDADLARMEKLFARYIGPMAKVLVRRESRNANSLDTLCRALASHIDKDADRRRFLAEAGF